MLVPACPDFFAPKSTLFDSGFDERVGWPGGYGVGAGFSAGSPSNQVDVSSVWSLASPA